MCGRESEESGKGYWFNSEHFLLQIVISIYEVYFVVFVKGDDDEVRLRD